MLDLEGTWDKKVNSIGNSSNNLSQYKTGTCAHPKMRCKFEFQRKESENIT